MFEQLPGGRYDCVVNIVFTRISHVVHGKLVDEIPRKTPLSLLSRGLFVHEKAVAPQVKKQGSISLAVSFFSLLPFLVCVFAQSGVVL